MLIKLSCLVTDHFQPCFADKDKAFQRNKTLTKRKAEAAINMVKVPKFEVRD